MESNRKSASKIYQDNNLYIITSITLMAILGGTIFNPALPSIQEAFNVSSEQVALVATLFQLPGAIVTPIFGVLADSFGRKQILVPSLLLFAVSGVLSGFAQNFRSLLEWRFLQGVGTASLEALSLTIISDLYTGKKLGTVMALNASIIGISSAVYPLIGGVLAGFSWRYPFLVAVVAIPVALFVLTKLKLPNRQTNAKNFKLKPYLKNTWSSINNRQVLGLMFAVMSQFMLQMVCLTYIPILAGNSLGASAAVIGIILTSMSLSLAFVASQLGLLFARNLTEIKLIKISFILYALALLIIPTVHNVWLLLIPILLIGAAQGISIPSTQALLAGLSAQESRAGFMAVSSTVQSWGQTLGPLLGSIIDLLWPTQAVFYASASFSLVSFVLFNSLLTTRKRGLSTPTQMPTVIVNPESSQQASYNPRPESPTILQQPQAQLIHVQTNRVIELPENLSVIHIGKPNDRIPPDVDVSEFPNSQIVSRMHAVILVEGYDYHIQDKGSSNGTYINKYPLLPGNWYKLRPGDRIGFGKGDVVTFLFQVS
jgi:MFS family permease